MDFCTFLCLQRNAWDFGEILKFWLDVSYKTASQPHVMQKLKPWLGSGLRRGLGNAFLCFALFQPQEFLLQ